MKTYNLKSMIIALKNCDDDHIGTITISEAKKELMTILDCDEYELGLLLKHFIDIDIDVKVSVK